MITYKNLIEAIEKTLGTDDITKGSFTKTAKNKFQGHLNRLHDKPNLTKDEEGALNHYSGSFHRDINDHLRFPENRMHPDYTEDVHKHYLKDLDSSLEKHRTKHDVHVWRGIRNRQGAETFKANPGDIFHDKGYVSTSINPVIAANFTNDHTNIFHIKVPKGSRAINPFVHNIGSSGEAEVLLPRGSKFRYEGSSEGKIKDKILSGNREFTIHHLTHIPEDN